MIALVFFVLVEIFHRSATPVVAEPRSVLVFADFACTRNAVGDPDDCLAVEALQRSGDVAILAVVSCGGNARKSLSFQIGQRYFPNILMFPGSAPRSREVTQTHRRLSELISTRRHKIKFLVLSPATDFAILVRHFPSVLDHADEVVFVAGQTRGDQFRAWSNGRRIRDMNFRKDPAAFAFLLPQLQQRRIKTQFIGFRAAMTTAIPRKLVPHGFIPLARRAWMRKTRFWFGKSLPPFDLVAAMAVTSFSGNLNCRKVGVKIGRDLEMSNAEYSSFSFCD